MTWDELQNQYLTIFGVKKVDWRLEFFKHLYDEGYLQHFHLKLEMDGRSRTRFDLLLYVLLREGYRTSGDNSRWINSERIRVMISPNVGGVFAGADIQALFLNDNPLDDAWVDRDERRSYVDSSMPEPIVEWLRRLPIDWDCVKVMPPDLTDRLQPSGAPEDTFSARERREEFQRRGKALLTESLNLVAEIETFGRGPEMVGIWTVHYVKNGVPARERVKIPAEMPPYCDAAMGIILTRMKGVR